MCVHACAYVYQRILLETAFTNTKTLWSGDVDRKRDVYFHDEHKRKEEDGGKKRLMAAETPFVTNGLFNLKYLIGFKAL